VIVDLTSFSCEHIIQSLPQVKFNNENYPCHFFFYANMGCFSCFCIFCSSYLQIYLLWFVILYQGNGYNSSENYLYHFFFYANLPLNSCFSFMSFSLTIKQQILIFFGCPDFRYCPLSCLQCNCCDSVLD